MQLRLDELLDAGLAVDDLPADFKPGTDLTPFLGSDSAIRDTPTSDAIAAGAAITFGVPWLSAEANLQWFGRRLSVWRHGLPAERLIGICMSRIGRQPEQFKPVFDAIRTAIVRLDAASETVLVSDQTAAARYVSRAAVLFGRRTLTVSANCESKTWSEWWTDAGTFRGNESTEPAVAVSPLLSGADPLDSPLGDRLLIGLAHRSVCVHSRPRGHTHSVLMSRLKSPAWPAGSVFVRRDGDAKSSEELIANGGVGWLILGDVESSATSPENRAIDQPTYRSFNHADYLTHCTRRYDGPWPGETEQQFLDDLLLDRQGADHSALATLCRIVGQQQLVAGSSVVREKHRWSACPNAPRRNLCSDERFVPIVANGITNRSVFAFVETG